MMQQEECPLVGQLDNETVQLLLADMAEPEQQGEDPLLAELLQD